MSNVQGNAINDFFGKRIYLLFAGILGIPIFIAAHAYARALNQPEDEAVAFATTLFFILGVFAGRFLAMVRTSRNKPLKNSTLIFLAIVIIACISWIFFLAEFPLRDRNSINLLLFWLPFFLMTISMGMFIKLTRSYTQQQLTEARTSAAHSQSELNLLQSQLSPHFLFNTLNNMYGLSISQHEKVPPLLLKLSELLRYSVYEANERYVPLKDEIAYINNYIEFEKLRIGDKLSLQSHIEQPPGKEVKIAPMLLIVFIENAFKHAKNTSDQRIYIDINLRIWEHYILFTVKNSHSVTKKENNAVTKNSGYGMMNVLKRLELLYPGEHTLDIRNTDNEYKVVLQLKMK